MSNHAMNEPFETVGRWRLPGDIEIPGKLSYRSDRIGLELMDSLRPMRSGPIHSTLDTYPVVHGVTREQEAVSLFRCAQTGYSLTFASSGVGKPENLWCHLAVVGAHVTEEQVYTELRCRIPGLQVLLSQRIIETVKDPVGYAFRVKNVPPETIVISGIDAELDFKLAALGSPKHSTATIVAEGWLHIRPREPKMLSWFLDQLWKVTDLLALLGSSPMPADRIEIKVGPDEFPFSVLLPRQSVKYCNYAEHHGGASVSLFEMSGELGGQFRFCERVPGKQQYGAFLNYLHERVSRSSIDLHLGVGADAAAIEAKNAAGLFWAGGKVGHCRLGRPSFVIMRRGLHRLMSLWFPR